MLPFLKKYWPVLVLVITSVIICAVNYTPGTSLSGWDTLHPEFNFGLNWERTISGVFREEQGLGAVAGHSHMAELPRIILLWIFNIFLPLNFLRYFYIFLTLLAGPIGMYFLLLKPFKTKQLPSFLGAMFYMLNLGTLQQFIVAFEMFNVLYATLPFLMLFAIEYMTKSKIKNQKSKEILILFSITTFLSTPMAYAATLWYVYFLMLCIFLFFYILPSLLKRNFLLLKKAIILISITIAINSFWILPNIYYVKNHASEVTSSQINTLFSPQAFLYNKEFGRFEDLLLMRSFLFDWGAYVNYNSYDKLLKPWIIHLQNPWVLLIGYSLGLISIIGLIYTSIRKDKIAIAFLPVTLVTLFFLLNDNFPTSFLYNLLREKIPILREAMRFPHSKFYVHFIFIYAVYFALGQVLLFKLLAKLPKKINQITSIIYSVIFCSALIYFMLPAFQGEFVSKFIRIKIPPVYTEMSEWFNEQDDERRIAPLPINSFWGWDYYNWYGNSEQSYQGAGFLWFNIKQPFLSRDFDRWTPYNENYYKEMSYAVYSQDPELLKRVLNKYNIGYILLDTSNIVPTADPTALFYTKIEKLLSNKELLEIESINRFGPNLSVYHFKPNKGYVYALSEVTEVAPIASTQTEDIAYKNYSDYIAAMEFNPSSNGSYFPFRKIINNQNRLITPFQISQNGIALTLPNEYKNANFDTTSYLKQEEKIPANLLVKRQNSQLELRLYPITPVEGSQSTPIETVATLPADDTEYILSINQNNIVALNKLEQNISYSLGRVYLNTKTDNSIGIYKNKKDVDFEIDFSGLNFALRPCNAIDKDQAFGINFLPEENGFSLTGKNTPLCMTIPLKEIISTLDGANFEEILLETTFNFGQNKNLNKHNPQPNICIVNLQTEGCTNNIEKNSSSNVSLTNQFAAQFGIKPDSYQDMGLKIFFDTSYSKSNQKISYTNFNFGLSKPVFYINFQSNILAQSIKPSFDKKSDATKLLIPFIENSELNKDLTTLPKTTGNCDENPIMQSDSNNKQVIKAQQDYIRYSSDQGTLCDHFSYPNLSQSLGHLLIITSRNINGLPISICATNYLSKRCDLYSSLTKSKDFTTDIFVLPPISTTEKGYDININNLGIKHTPAVNDLKSIQIVPFPYSWLSGLETNTAQARLKSTVKKVEYQNFNSFTYLVDANELTDSSVIALSQSYEKGWRAYKVQSSKFKVQSWFKYTFPFIFGEEIKDHVLVNNWENGWVLDGQQLKANGQQLIIIYLPQYLEYLGFILLGSTFLITLFALKNKVK